MATLALDYHNSENELENKNDKDEDMLGAILQRIHSPSGPPLGRTIWHHSTHLYTRAHRYYRTHTHTHTGAQAHTQACRAIHDTQQYTNCRKTASIGSDLWLNYTWKTHQNAEDSSHSHWNQANFVRYRNRLQGNSLYV